MTANTYTQTSSERERESRFN